MATHIELLKVHKDKYIYNTTDLPDDMILSGWVSFEGAIFCHSLRSKLQHKIENPFKWLDQN